MRDYVLSCITATIQILEQEHRLYGGSAETVKAQLALVEEAHELLTDEQYHLANMILFHMKMLRLGNDEMAGWEFADQLIPECFESLCIEFADNICRLPIECILRKPVIDLLMRYLLTIILITKKRTSHFCHYD